MVESCLGSFPQLLFIIFGHSANWHFLQGTNCRTCSIQRSFEANSKLRSWCEGIPDRGIFHSRTKNPRCTRRSQSRRNWTCSLCRVCSTNIGSPSIMTAIRCDGGYRIQDWLGYGSDGIARVHGMSNVQAEELVE